MLLPNYLDEEQQARRLLSIAVARQAAKFVTQAATARVKLSPTQMKEGIKAKIVGREGRNVRYFEEQSGVDLLLNEEVDAVIVSSFDPFRREVGRVALESLIRDGRINPPRIQEILAEARLTVEQSVREAGSAAAKSLGLENLHPAVLRVVGTLKFRHSYGQNQLEHAIETAEICGSLAAELGFDVSLARRAGLLHDLGKALDQTHDSGHAKAGAEFARRFGEEEQVVQAILAHHEEVTPSSWLDHLVIAADAVSGGRPGARQGSTQVALERVETMERIAHQVGGVTAAYAVQAGREVRVFVDSTQVGDEGLPKIAKEIGDRIQAELVFPGQIKVTVLRELRVTEVVSR